MTRARAMPDNVVVTPRVPMSRIDRSTMERAREGVEEAFETVYRQTVDDVGRYVTAIVGDAAQAEDAVAQTFADVWRELPGLRELDRFEAWLFRIAHNRALDVIKRRGGEQADPSDELAAPSLADPAEELLRRERAAMLRSAILELPDDQREVVVLRLLRDLSHAEVGRQTGRSEAASRVMLHRALQSLRAVLRASEPASQGAGA